LSHGCIAEKNIISPELQEVPVKPAFSEAKERS